MSEQSSYFTLYFHMGGTFYIMLNSAVTDPPNSPLMAMIQFQWWGWWGGGGVSMVQTFDSEPFMYNSTLLSVWFTKWHQM